MGPLLGWCFYTLRGPTEVGFSFIGQESERVN
jgi:hypothetical protein